MTANQSLLKTMILAAVLFVAFSLVAFISRSVVPGAIGALAAIAAASLSAACAIFVAAALVTMHRQRRIAEGRPDLYLELNDSRSEASLEGDSPSWCTLRRAISNRVCGHRLMVGDLVRIKSLEQIRSTLDDEGALDGLPFMEEMAHFCGKEVRVYRIVDKVYDYGKTRLMRKLERSVLLAGLRCNGAAHGGCQAACYLLWKADWLEPASPKAPEAPSRLPMAVAHRQAAGILLAASTPEAVYSCQYTSLSRASSPLTPLPLRNLMIPLISGNVSLPAWLLVLGTRVVNIVQDRRGGASYPAMPTGTAKSTRPVNLGLVTGQVVTVRTPEEIARTLDANSKNRGLWFDRDMAKFCGQRHVVRGRVDKIIDVVTGKMVQMKTACITLEAVHYTGEFQLFGEQHEFLYWREAWLQPND